MILTEKYSHQDIEKKWQRYWRQNCIYKWEDNLPRKETFVIDTPPLFDSLGEGIAGDNCNRYFADFNSNTGCYSTADSNKKML